MGLPPLPASVRVVIPAPAARFCIAAAKVPNHADLEDLVYGCFGGYVCEICWCLDRVCPGPRLVYMVYHDAPQGQACVRPAQQTAATGKTANDTETT